MSFVPRYNANSITGTTNKRPTATVVRSASAVLKIVPNVDGKGLL
jgi:hypothetical protein